MGLWWRCFGPGRSLGLVLGGGRLGGLCAVVAGGGAGRLAGWVGSVGESSYSAERGEGGGRDHGGYPVPAPEATAAASRWTAPGGPARAGRVAAVTREA